MARGGEIGHKRKTRNNVRLERNGSDESDEDYRVDEDEEFNHSEDDYCSSLAGDESEESLGECNDDEEEEWVEKRDTTKKVGRPRGRKTFQTRKKSVVVKPRKKKVANSEEQEQEEEEDYDDLCLPGVRQQKKVEVSRLEEDDIEALCQEDEDDFVDENPRKKPRVSRTEVNVDSYSEGPKEKDKVSYSEENEDGDYDVSDDSDDEEFTLGEVFKSTRRKPVQRRVLRTKNRSNLSGELKLENPVSRIRKTIQEWHWGRRRRATVIVDSDSDFVNSEPSDYEYTISEEEREQVREATAFCEELKTNLRSSSSLKLTEEEKLVPLKGKRPGRKGKQKVVDLNIEIGKQVCGICLSEEGKKTVRGVLNCCSHYFCFACIMEWSKVESRCPLCKQRFATISRTARTDGGNDLRDAVFPVPERDQVYQPSEEELWGYLDPFENFLCTECLLGGDDALMLLCDICDSPAHTFCVGLGREVPDGNWYCDGCRPTALASSNAQGLNPTPDHGASNNLSVGSSPGSAVRETFDLNEAYIPDTPLSQVNGYSQSPRHIRHLQPTSPASGSGASTLHDRRRIQRVIQEFLNSRSRQSDGSDGVASASAINLFDSQVNGHSQSPRRIGHLQATSPASGAGEFAPLERRRIQQLIQEFLNRSRQTDGSDGVASTSAINIFDSGHLQPTSPASGSGQFAPHERRRIQQLIQEFLNRSRQTDGNDGVASASAINLFDSQVNGHSQSPRHIGHLQPTSPASGAGQFALHERRRIQQLIQEFLNRSRQTDGSDGVASASAINLFDSQVNGHSQSPRHIGHLQPTSPASGAGEFALHERRRIQQLIQEFLNRSRQTDGSDGVASASAINLFDSQVNGHSQSPQHIGHLQPTSPASGAGEFALHERRQIQQLIQEFLNRSRQTDGSDGVASTSAINLFDLPIGRGVSETQNTVMPRMMPPRNIFPGRLPDYNTPSLYNREPFSPRLSNLRVNAFQSQASTSNVHTFGGQSQSEYTGINARIGGGFGQQ